MLRRFIISVCLLLIIGGSVELFAKDFNKRDAEFAAGLNIDVDQLEPFLKHVSSSILDSGLNYQDIKQIQSEIKKMQKDNGGIVVLAGSPSIGIASFSKRGFPISTVTN
ncbi:hypothetical protein BSAF29S_00412 [Bacillus safensis subsp. safensis]